MKFNSSWPIYRAVGPWSLLLIAVLLLGQGQAWGQQKPESQAGKQQAQGQLPTLPAGNAANAPDSTEAPAKEVETLRKSQQVLKAAVDSLRTQLKAEARDASAESLIATMMLRTKPSYTLYTYQRENKKSERWQPVTGKSLKLERIEFSTESGRLTRTNVYGNVVDDKEQVLDKDVSFTNNRTSLVLNRSVRKSPYLGVSGGGNEYVRYADLVQVTPRGSRRFLPDNETWELSPKKPSHDIHTGGGLGSLLEVALFTDLLATLNNEPNALVTTEIASNLLLNPNPTGRNSPVFLLGAIRPYVSVARLDTQFDTLRTNPNGLIDRPSLLQRNYLRFGANLNVFTLDNGRHVTWQFNTSWTRTITRVAGPMGTRDTLSTNNAYQNLYGFEVLATVRRQRNFGCDFFLTALLHNVQSQRPVIANTTGEWVLRPGAQFYYYPFGSPSNKLFFRVTSFVFPESRQRDFAQLQVGYSISLGGLLPASTSGATPATRSLSSGVY